jgi:hypothetical protein
MIVFCCFFFFFLSCNYFSQQLLIYLFKLGYALSHCSEDNLMQVLPIWQNLEIRTKCKGVGVDLGPRSAKIDDVTQELECVGKLKALKEELLQSDTPVALLYLHLKQLH